MSLLGKRCVIKPDSCGEMDGSYALGQLRRGSFEWIIAKRYLTMHNLVLKRAAALCCNQ
jgi:hypothetical protein